LLAALSREGITPKLVWTKRTGNGDVLTAQEWLDGRLLSPQEIGQRSDVIHLLYQMHHSLSLKNMLEKIGGQEVLPIDLLTQYMVNLPNEVKQNHYLAKVFRFLEDHIPPYHSGEFSVVHGDVTHRNWLQSEQGLYLVDWDSVMLADPAVDLGILLGHYVEFDQWPQWLTAYGMRPTQENIDRIFWYATINFLQEIVRQYRRGDSKNMNKEILLLKRTFTY
jgi:Predicted choline kinase involved in LPS biosynthesis